MSSPPPRAASRPRDVDRRNSPGWTTIAQRARRRRLRGRHLRAHAPPPLPSSIGAALRSAAARDPRRPRAPLQVEFAAVAAVAAAYGSPHRVNARARGVQRRSRYDELGERGAPAVEAASTRRSSPSRGGRQLEAASRRPARQRRRPLGRAGDPARLFGGAACARVLEEDAAGRSAAAHARRRRCTSGGSAQKTARITSQLAPPAAGS